MYPDLLRNNLYFSNTDEYLKGVIIKNMMRKALDAEKKPSEVLERVLRFKC
jgi:hypothetical protein